MNTITEWAIIIAVFAILVSQIATRSRIRRLERRTTELERHT